MKRLIVLVVACIAVFAVNVAFAGDYHTTGKLKCAQCHVMHGQQSHEYLTGGEEAEPVSPEAPFEGLLRNRVNDLCLACHDTRLGGHNSDVFGGNTTGEIRQGGGLNIHAGPYTGWSNDAGYSEIGGHTLYSTDVAPGGTFSDPGGLNCVDCHMPHGHVPTQYRNLWTSTTPGDKFQGKDLTYQPGGAIIDKSKDVYETASLNHSYDGVWFNEPDQTKSAYGAWCQSCHTNFHGAGGAANMGGQSGGWTFASQVGWDRHPTSDVNIGHQAGADFVSSLTRYQGLTNKVKVMSGTATVATASDWATSDATPSCFTCHKGHGNKNGFALIMMKGTGAVSEEGDAAGMDPATGAYAGAHPIFTTPLCQQCHIQGL